MTRKRRASEKSTAASAPGAGNAREDRTRRTEILDSAASLIASSGLRTSLQEIADAAGILAGSLYHHFESKEAILIELIQRYHADLDRIGEDALRRRGGGDASSASDRIAELGSAIASCAVRHRAALQLTFYEPPAGANRELAELARQPPRAVHGAMLAILEEGRREGSIRPDIDLPTLADRICQTMLHVGLDVIRHDAPADRVAAILCRILLDGLASRPPSDRSLDRSTALRAANGVIETWSDGSAAHDDKAAHVRSVARAEFGRRGYEATTVRDIAAAAGLGTGTVYRLIGSKEELLASIMRSFGRKVGAGWVGVLRSDATPIEKLDALTWVDINALDQFHDEFKIQLAWMRQSPPDTPNPGWSFATRLRQLRSLLTEGVRSGELRIEGRATTGMLARCVIDVLWMPENIVRAAGRRAALIHARDTVLRGVAAGERGGKSA